MPLRFGTIRQTQFIANATPNQVYRAFLNAKIHTAFTGARATGTGRVGEKITAWDGYITGKTVRLIKGRKIVQEWRTTEFPAEYPNSSLELNFKREKDGTRVVMIHSRVPASQTAMYREGWISSYRDPLEDYFRKRAMTKDLRTSRA